MYHLRIVDLSKVLTVEEVADLFDRLKRNLTEEVEEALDHWTDDEGLHRLPFERDLEGRFLAELQQTLMDAVRDTARSVAADGKIEAR